MGGQPETMNDERVHSLLSRKLLTWLLLTCTDSGPEVLLCTCSLQLSQLCHLMPVECVNVRSDPCSGLVGCLVRGVEWSLRGGWQLLRGYRMSSQASSGYQMIGVSRAPWWWVTFYLLEGCLKWDSKWFLRSLWYLNLLAHISHSMMRLPLDLPLLAFWATMSEAWKYVVINIYWKEQSLYVYYICECVNKIQTLCIL